jgi:hypothetical protein
MGALLLSALPACSGSKIDEGGQPITANINNNAPEAKNAPAAAPMTDAPMPGKGARR